MERSLHGALACRGDSEGTAPVAQGVQVDRVVSDTEAPVGCPEASHVPLCLPGAVLWVPLLWIWKDGPCVRPSPPQKSRSSNCAVSTRDRKLAATGRTQEQPTNIPSSVNR